MKNHSPEPQKPSHPHHVPDEARDDIAEKPGTTHVDPDHAEDLADEWGKESFPSSDPPAHY